MKSIKRVLAALTCSMCMLQVGGCSLTDILGSITGA